MPVNKKKIYANPLEKFRDIDTVIMDVDGVLTNNQMLITEAGEMLRSMSARDGYVIKRALSAGIRIAVITGGYSEGVSKRLEGLGIKDVFIRARDKVGPFEELVVKYDLDPDRILYIGDDMPDYFVMQKTGMAACPIDAIPEIRELCDYVSPVKGGEGCVRDILEKLLRIQNKWMPEQYK